MTIRRKIRGALGLSLCISLVAGANVALAAKSTDILPTELSDRTDYTLFEIGQVRPILLSNDGTQLFALNTPDDRLEVYKVAGDNLTHVKSISVGMRPVAIAERANGDLWVVNHLSDSISIVDVDSGEVTRTLLVGDEPRDIVFAGENGQRAFITTAHRGQNTPFNDDLATPSVGRADVWVFDANNPGSSMTGDPLTIISLFADTPRALAVSPDGKKVYAAAFHSGNQTTVINDEVAADLDEVNIFGDPQPKTSLIAKYIDGAWIDSVGNDVTHLMKFELPDYDVFTIDAMASTPVAIEGPAGVFPHVGTTLFNMTVNPATGAIYVANTEANNYTRFEGPGLDPVVNTTTRGNIVQSRITVIKDGQVKPIHLNKHIDYSVCCDAPGNAEARKSLAFPRQMAITEDGSQLYVTALGSAKVGVFDTAKLENDTFVPSEASHIKLSAGGPSGLALDESNQRLYVMTRFNNGISVVNLATKEEVSQVIMHNPEPAKVVEGRPFLYDAFLSSSHGDSACASCHIDGDMDHLAWDLGDPTVEQRPMPGISDIGSGVLSGTTAFALGLPACGPDFPRPLCIPEEQMHFRSNKGPMTTQTLAGMDNHGPMHWRGDRADGTADDPGAQPNEGMFDERFAFKAFNGAFPGLLGRDEELTEDEMDKYTDFVLESTLPPNPIRNLDNSLTEQQAFGKEIYMGGADGRRLSDRVRTCEGCHILDEKGNAEYGVENPGFFGSDGRYTFEFLNQMFKVPHLRNMYQKVGMFGVSSDGLGLNANPGVPFRFPEEMGDQIRGFGFSHDGSADTIFTFLQNVVFIDLGPNKDALGPLASSAPPNPGGFPVYIPPGTYSPNPDDYPDNLKFLAEFNDPFYQQVNPETGVPVAYEELHAVEAFMFAFPNNMAPIMGQQITVSAQSSAIVKGRLVLMEQRAQITEPREECDLIGKAIIGGREVGYLYDPSSSLYLGADESESTKNALLNAASSVTFTCVPPGDGVRAGLDRDLDGYFDTVEVDAGSDPADANSVPGVVNPGDLTLRLGATGSTFIKAAKGTAPLTGEVVASTTLATGAVTGDIELDPTTGEFDPLYRILPTVADIRFEQVAPISGTFMNSLLDVTATLDVYLPEVAADLFGIIQIPLAGGVNCKANAPISPNLKTPDGEVFSLTNGGSLTSVYSLPKLQDCGFLTFIISIFMGGNGNTIDLDLEIIEQL